MARIAVVDDEPSVRLWVTTLLRERGHDVRAFGTFAQAYEGLSDAPPDLLLADVTLPDGDGLELVARLRLLHAESFPAIVLSGRVSEGDFMRGFAAGACDYLAKPLSPDELLARCALHLGRGAEDGGTVAIGRDLPGDRGLAFRRYEVRGVLGRGGSGIVYDAFDTTRGEPVALKVLGAGASTGNEERLRFLRETYALSSVRHPAVVEVTDFGSSQGRLYYAMTRVEGPTLRRRVRDGAPLEPAAALPLARRLLEALAALEQARVLHRDVAPSNVLLRGGRADDPVLVDFGLAKRAFDRGLTLPEVIVGTPGYVAPEVVTDGAADARSDLFSLGCVLVFALTGQDPFPDLRGLPLLHHMATHPVRPPATLGPGPLRRLLEALLALEPRLRPEGAEAALALLVGP